MSSVKAAIQALRPTGPEWIQPADERARRITKVFVREVTQYNNQLWVHGNRQVVHRDTGRVAYRSVSVQVLAFQSHILVDVSPLESTLQASVLDHLHAEMNRRFSKLQDRTYKQDPLGPYEIVRRQQLCMYDYGRRRPFMKIPVRFDGHRNKVHTIFEQPFTDHLGRTYKLDVYHTKSTHSIEEQFLHATDIRLQSWITFHRLQNVRTPQTWATDEYRWYFDPKRISLSAPQRVNKPMLCATYRARIDCSPDDPPTLENATTQPLRTVCSDIYWVGHDDPPPVVRVKLGVEDDRAAQRQVDEWHDPFAEFDEGADQRGGQPTLTIEHQSYPSSGAMLKTLQTLLNRTFQIDCLVTLEDDTPDAAHLLLRLPSHNLSRVRKPPGVHEQYQPLMPKPRQHGGGYYLNTPGISRINMLEYMKKLQNSMKPRFDGFTLLDAVAHKKVYKGVKVPMLSTHEATRAAWKSQERLRGETDLESRLLRLCEQGTAIILDAAAISRVCSAHLTGCVENGQQFRVYPRIKHDAHKSGFFVNKEALNRAYPTVPSATHNSFPPPPESHEMINTPLHGREGADAYAREVEQNLQHLAHTHWKFYAHMTEFLKDKAPELAAGYEGMVKRRTASSSSSSSASSSSSSSSSSTRPMSDEVDMFGDPITVAEAAELHSRKRKREMGKKAPSNAKRQKKTHSKYKGGYVREPIPHNYRTVEEAVATLDFASLYPSIIQSDRLCYSCMVGDARMFLDPRLEIKYVEISEGECVGFVMSFNGVPVRTILPQTERDLVAERKRIKSLMKTAKKECAKLCAKLGVEFENTGLTEVTIALRDHTKSEQERKLWRELQTQLSLALNYDKQQLGSKVTQNAVYGFTGVEKFGIMPSPPLMAAITSIGRWMNKVCGEYGYRVYLMPTIYGDTDSVIMQLAQQAFVPGTKNDRPDAPMEDRVRNWMWNRFDKVAAEMSQLFASPHEMELENMVSPFWLSNIKKNYGGVVYEQPYQCKKDPKLAGLGFLKRDRCAWVRLCGFRFFTGILRGEDPDVLVDDLRQQIAYLASGRIHLDNLAVSCRLKDRSEYSNDSLIQLTVANRIEEREGIRPSTGCRLSYLVMQGGGKVYTRGEHTEYVKQNAATLRTQVDLNHYLDQLKSILKVVTVHHPDLAKRVEYHIMDGHRQIRRQYARWNGTDIDSFFEGVDLLTLDDTDTHNPQGELDMAPVNELFDESEIVDEVNSTMYDMLM